MKASDEIVMWEEVHDDENSGEESEDPIIYPVKGKRETQDDSSSDEELGEGTSLVAKMDRDIDDMFFEEMIKAGGRARASLKLSKRDEFVYLLVGILMLMANLAVGVISLLERIEGIGGGESCRQPLAKYLFISSLHAFSNSLFIFCYLVVLRRNVKREFPNVPFLEYSDDRPLWGMLETLLFAMAVTQIGLGVLAEVWVAEVGGYTGQASLCESTAPHLFYATFYIGLYQISMIFFILAALIRSACCG